MSQDLLARMIYTFPKLYRTCLRTPSASSECVRRVLLVLTPKGPVGGTLRTIYWNICRIRVLEGCILLIDCAPWWSGCWMRFKCRCNTNKNWVCVWTFGSRWRMATATTTTSTNFLLFSVLVNTTMANPEYSLQTSRTIFVLSIFFPCDTKDHTPCVTITLRKRITSRTYGQTRSAFDPCTRNSYRSLTGWLQHIGSLLRYVRAPQVHACESGANCIFRLRYRRYSQPSSFQIHTTFFSIPTPQLVQLG